MLQDHYMSRVYCCVFSKDRTYWEGIPEHYSHDSTINPFPFNAVFA
jgi:hypothetical protein